MGLPGRFCRIARTHRGRNAVSWTVLLSALASASLHAGWNVVAKNQRVPSEAILGIIFITALACLAAVPSVGLPPAAAWPWLVAAAVFSIIYSRALMAAYDRAPFSLTYSIVRAVVPPTLLFLGILFFTESFTPLALVGLGLVVTSLLLFSMPNSGQAGDARGFLLAGLAGSILAVSYACDIKGARMAGGHLHAIIQYGVASSLLTAAGLLALALLEKQQPIEILKRNWRACSAGAALLIASYFLALWAYTQGPISLVAPIRETGILFGGLLAFAILREHIGAKQWTAIGLAAIGAVLINVK